MPIRPHALISVFAAFAKSALILPLTECISQYKWLYFSRNQQRLQDLQTFDDASRGPLGSLADDAPIRDQTLKCTYETPSGLHVDFCRGKIPGRDNLCWTRLNATAELSLSTLSNITHHAFVRVHEDIRKPGTTGQDYGIEALGCTLYWCARTNSGLGVTNGIVNPGNVTRTPLAGIRDLTTINQDSEFPIQLTTLVAPESWNGTKGFTINVFDMVCIADLIQVLLHTSLLTENYYMYRSNTYRTAYALWKSPSLATTMDNVAESLTYAVRRTQNSTMITGQSFHDETYMRVRWAWFALPASLVICTGGTLVTLAIINDRHNVLLWKSSMLPLLFYGFEQPIDAPVQKLSHVDARAQNTKVRLHITEINDLRFVLLLETVKMLMLNYIIILSRGYTRVFHIAEGLRRSALRGTFESMVRIVGAPQVVWRWRIPQAGSKAVDYTPPCYGRGLWRFKLGSAGLVETAKVRWTTRSDTVPTLCSGGGSHDVELSVVCRQCERDVSEGVLLTRGADGRPNKRGGLVVVVGVLEAWAS
ncbi:hypothetical protein SLS56_007750 [Neofusicoccum ribis]|uniref:Uncharacterized protein n=1 Tax=Neofusicoccum ribis TaxID=45134 RepID=A0ABR3SM65_9PEZI